MDTHVVSGGGGAGLPGSVAGPTAVASVVLVHASSQSRPSRRTPFESDPSDDLRLIAPDLRGNGESETPVGGEPYRGPTLWAADFRVGVGAFIDGDPVLLSGFVLSLGRLSAFGLPGGFEPAVVPFVTFSLPSARIVGSSVVGDSPGAHLGRSARPGRSGAVASEQT